MYLIILIKWSKSFRNSHSRLGVLYWRIVDVFNAEDKINGDITK